MVVNWNAKFSMRALLSFLIVGCFIGGSGLTIVYHATTPQLLEEEITEDKTIRKYKDIPALDDSKLFNLWLGSVLGYAGAIITFWYKADKTPDNLDDVFKKLVDKSTLSGAVTSNKLTKDEADKLTKRLGL